VPILAVVLLLVAPSKGSAGAAFLAGRLMGAVLSIANPKELLLGVGAGFAVGGAGLPIGATIVTVLVFTLTACLSVVTPVVAFLIAGERMLGPLESARTLLVRHNAAIMSVVLLIISAALIGGGISDL
jgi:hypothetical protein